MRLILIITIICYFCFVFFFVKKFQMEYYYCVKFETSWFFLCSTKEKIKSFIFLFFFFLYYFVYLRILNLLSEKNRIIDLYDCENKFNSYWFKYNFDLFFLYFVLVLIFSLLLFVFLSMFLINYFMFFFAKKHYLRLHYYYFIRNKNYIKLIDIIQSLELRTYNLVNSAKLFLLIYVIQAHGVRIIVFFLLFKNLIFDLGIIDLSLIPYYSLYYFFYNIYSFIAFRFKADFEIALALKYYPKLEFKIEKNEYKIAKYQYYLLFGFCEYKIKDCIYLHFMVSIPENWLVLNTYKYSDNKKPNDFYFRILKHSPEYLKLRFCSYRYNNDKTAKKGFF